MPETPLFADPIITPICELVCNAVQDGICVQTPDARIVYVNKAFEEIMGIDRNTIFDRPCSEVFNCAHSHDNIPHACARVTAQVSGETAVEELLGRRNGQRIRSRISPLKDPNGAVVAFVTVVTDITYEVAHEREMARYEDMARFGELASGLAHEIKNPLAGIQGAMDILLQRRDESDPEKPVLENVRREVGRINSTVQMLLDRVKSRAPNLHPTSLSDIVQSAMSLARASMTPDRRERIKLDFRPCTVTARTLVDAPQMEDAVFNLIQNGIESIDERGTVDVSVEEDDQKHEMKIIISDDGRGIQESDLSRIFSPFFTTNPKGTGLGLPAVRRIVRAHGGRVDVNSKPGFGSTFTIHLPATRTS